MTMRPPLANLNGELMPLDQVKVSALDRGFLFGDAVYEVLRIYKGKPWLLAEHWQRLVQSLAAIRIRGVDLDRLKRRMFETITASGFQEALAYIQITRGAAPRSHAFPVSATPLEFMFVQDYADPYAGKRVAGVAVITHPDLRWQRCDIKSTNLLGNVLATQAAAEAGCAEALLYKPDGTLTEATHSSFFAVIDGILLATPLGSEILPGITRAFLEKLAARIGVPFHEQHLNKDSVTKVSELFLSGTGAEVLPVVRVDGQTVGNGNVGPVTMRLYEAYQQAVKEFASARFGSGTCRRFGLCL
ncbi:MAG TPA: aminotransferase class IV [Gemmataceae bacterium]|nr:aminotransferase class IV [Gemmataceae bacterium]